MVTTSLRTRWTSRDVILSHNSCHAYVVKNAKPRPILRSSLLSPRFSLGSGVADIDRQFFSGSEAVQLIRSQLAETLEELHLCVEGVVGTVKPETAFCATMNSEGTAQRI